VSAMRWLKINDSQWEARTGTHLTASVRWGADFSVTCPGGEISGDHSTLDNAKAQVESWLRWRLGGMQLAS
jgi:hypothetical protein